MSAHNSTPNSYRIENGVAYIACQNISGEVVAEAIIDETDLERVLAVGRWFGNWHAQSQSFYVKAKKGRLLLHRFVINASSGTVVDHVNHNTLDCRKSNLRAGTHAQNMQNRKTHSNSKSGVRGGVLEEGLREVDGADSPQYTCNSPRILY